MASYNELNALIDAYINRNGVQAITGQILNGVLKAMVEQLGRGYTIMGAAIPTTDPGTPDGPECYFASETGTYTDFNGLQVAPGELALLCYTPSDGWTKATIYEGFRQVGATIDGNVGTPSVGVSYANGVLSFDFHNMKGNTGDAAGFGTIGADITGGVGTPGVTVESSGPATAKNLQFHFTNLKGETGVTSVVATVDNTTGTPTCTVSLVGQQLTLAFSGLKGAQGDTGSSVDYPFTIVNNLTTDDATQALSAAQGVILDGKVTQLEAKVVGFIYKTSATKFSDYNPSILELYFTPKALEGVANIDFRNYGGKLYAVAKDANSSALWVVDSFALGRVQNGIVTPLAATSAGGSISVGDTVGYVVFSDIVTFSATTVSNSYSSPLNLDFVARHTNSPRICSYIENNTNLKWRKNSKDPTISDTYEKCVAELYINKQICQKSGVTGVACSCYGTDFYVYGRDSSSIIWSMKRSLSTFKNGEVCPLFITTAGGGMNVYDTIGYIVFSDVTTFGTKTTSSGTVYLNSDTVMKIENFPLIQSSFLYTKGFFPLAEKSPIFRINESVSAYAIYEGCVKEFWVNPKYLNGIVDVSVKNWGGTIYVDAKKANTTTAWACVGSLANYANGDVIPLKVTNAGGDAALNDIVGYIIFSDIATFKTTNHGNYVYTDVDRATRLDLNKSIWYAVTAFQSEIAQSINEKIIGGLDVILPSTIYAAVGVQLNIYNDAIAVSMDKGLNSPTNYIVRWSCGKGTITNRGFRYTPVAGDIGDVSLTCYIYTISGELYATKTCTIKVVAASIATAKRVVFFGDSTGAGSASALYADFNDAGLFSGTKPTMLGVRGTTPKYEAFGGARWADYATEGRAAYRCQVSGVGAIALNSTYTNNGFTWRVVEVNVTEGVGNILITKDDLYSSVDAPETNGTLVPVGSGDNIAYTGATKEAGNPLWHNGAIDFSHYRNTLGLGANEKIDLVSFQLGLNGQEDNATLRQYIINLYNAAVADNADCIFIIGLVTGPCNTIDAYGVNYGAGNWMDAIRRYHAKSKVYKELVVSGDYPNMRMATPNLNIDRYYGFPLGTRAVSARNNTQEEYHTNFVHPSESGYAQIGDAFFAAYIATLNE